MIRPLILLNFKREWSTNTLILCGLKSLHKETATTLCLKDPQTSAQEDAQYIGLLIICYKSLPTCGKGNKVKNAWLSHYISSILCVFFLF